MNSPPPPLQHQQNADTDHLRLLAVFHFVFAALAAVGLLFLLLHFLFLNSIMHGDAHGGLGLFKVIYAVIAAFIVAGGAVNLLSGLFIQQRKHRLFSLIVAGLNCLQFPFGTALGVFTFIVLLRDSVRERYNVGA